MTTHTLTATQVVPADIERTWAFFSDPANLRRITPSALGFEMHTAPEPMHDGQVIASHMAREHVSLDELRCAMREHGIAEFHQVAISMLEVDGSISFLRSEDINPNTPNHHARRRKKKKKQ